MEVNYYVGCNVDCKLELNGKAILNQTVIFPKPNQVVLMATNNRIGLVPLFS